MKEMVDSEDMKADVPPVTLNRAMHELFVFLLAGVGVHDVISRQMLNFFFFFFG